MLRILRDDAFQQGTRFGWPFQPQQALAQMCARINVLWVALHGRAIATFGLFKLPFLEMKVAKLGVMMRVIQIMDLGFQLFHAALVESAREFEAASGRRRAAVYPKIIP